MGLASRAYSSYGYYDYYNTDPWDRTAYLDYHAFGNTKLFFARFAFECLILLALISFSVWCCTLRNSVSPLRGAIAALTIWMIAQILNVIYFSLYLALAVVKESYVIAIILEYIFELISYCLVFLTFYMIIHKLFDRLTTSGHISNALSIFHWVVLAIITILSIADLGLNTASDVKTVEGDYTFALFKHQDKLTSARAIIYFVASLEILACAIFIAVKGTRRFSSKMPIHSFLVASLSWFGYNLMWAVVDIRYLLDFSYSYLVTGPPVYLYLVETIFEFVFIIGIFSGILLCIMFWHKVEQDKNVEVPVTSVHQPYAGGHQPYAGGPIHHYQA